MKVLLNTTPLGNAHAMRGIGMYTRMLQQELEKLKTVELVSTEPADLVHYPFFDLFATTLPVKRKLPTVVTIHDVIPLLFPDNYPVGIKGKARFLKQRLALKSVSAIMTDSFASKWDIVKHLNVPASKVHVVYLAANPEMGPAEPSDVALIKEKYNLPSKYVLYVGDINYNKNLPQLIKAFKFLPTDIHLVLVGKNFTPQDIPEWQDIERQIALSDVGQQIHFVNTVKSEDISDLAAIYSGAICYVQPSLAEGFGLPVLEAIQCQTPVIVTGNSSLVEIGGHVVTYSGTEAEALANSIMTVNGWSQAERASHVQTASSWSKRFSWQKTAAQTVEVYQQALTTTQI